MVFFINHDADTAVFIHSQPAALVILFAVFRADEMFFNQRLFFQGRDVLQIIKFQITVVFTERCHISQNSLPCFFCLFQRKRIF